MPGIWTARPLSLLPSSVGAAKVIVEPLKRFDGPRTQTQWEVGRFNNGVNASVLQSLTTNAHSPAKNARTAEIDGCCDW